MKCDEAPDFVVITASTPVQAECYRSLVRSRQEGGLYPASVAFRFFCDPPRGRVGSGGGTVLALHRLLLEEAGAAGNDEIHAHALRFFGAHRVLILHAGGESRRLPCYVPEGKLFAPLAMASESRFPPVVLDCLLALYMRFPWRRGEAIVASGDVIVSFDGRLLSGGGGGPWQQRSREERGDLCGFGTATSLAQGSRHGVFGCDAAAAPADAVALPVRDFLQKAPVETLRTCALLPSQADGAERCAVDTGIFSMSPSFVGALLQWAAQQTEDAFRMEGCAPPAGCAAATGVYAVIDALADARLFFDFYLEVQPRSDPRYDMRSR